MHKHMLSCYCCVRLFVTLWTVACQVPPVACQGILQARILEWVAMPSSGVFLTQGSKLSLYVFCIDRWVLCH